ncbi:putative phospholipid-transporting ATPase VD [Armadillidium nasatum]|uniref:Phospholipid-transporting ATPase n=1 Tax=Armadillidium nasatum TaxID=96803 RepID=A0A5N5SKV7_9CRUS|nr:putative phospholipid-transporting ATPase VD [Armadillidium nasatum]
MIFQRCSINGVDYDHSPLIINDKQENSRDTFLINHHLLDELKTLELQYLYSQPGSRAAVITKSSSVSQRQNSQRILDFFFTLTACNTVIVARHPHKDQMNASGMIIESTLEDKNASDSPRHSQGSKNPLFRSLFPAPRSLSPIASSPSSSPPGTPEGSPKHSHIFHLPRIPQSFGFRSNQTPEIKVNTFQSVPENETAPDCTNIKLARPTDLALNGNHIHSLPASRTPSPATPLESQKPFYEAESPDELALVDAAYKYGCKLLRRNLHSILLSLPGIGVTEYEILNVLPFDSTRKRMSIIVKNPETGEKILYCKGADSAVLDNLVQRPDESTQLRIFQTEQHLNQYSKRGLRVLCMAKRHISDTEYEEWALIHKEAENTLANREVKLLESYNKIEINMQLLGATGIEDRLQDGVPETVQALRKAGINVWVLTGDKQETAINIAYSCALFSQNMEILKLNGHTKDQTEHTLASFVNQVEMEEEAYFRGLSIRSDPNLVDPSVADTTGGSTSTLERRRRRRKERGLVVDGKTLVYILDRRANLRGLFLQLATQCQAVMCCRATPLQKALIVRLAKEHLQVLTLAIGDGANDVSMIQTADVGVGISGVEGRQAVLSSDFAITRFRHLQKLLLVHGHWCYDRLAKIILYFFYKNANFVFLLMWYQLYCGFSTAVMIDELYLVMFNLSFTSIPPICVGIYDQDAPEDILLSKPELYSKTRRGKVYTKTSFWINTIDALYQSIVMFFVAVGVYNHSEAGVYEFGMTILHSCVITQLLHICIEIKSWTVIQGWRHYNFY